MLGVGRAGPLGVWTAGAADEEPSRRGPAGHVAGAAGHAPAGSEPSTVGPPIGRPRPGDEAERIAWAVLASVDGLGPVGLVTLVARWGSAREVVDAAGRRGGAARIAAASHARGCTALVAERIAAAARDESTVAAALESAAVHVLTLDDAAYPVALARVELPPPVLFVRGEVDAMNAIRRVAIVGTRRPTDSGRTHAARLAGAVARTGATVISGLAVGIDGVAHSAAVDVGGLTVAVLGGGHAHAVPRGHARLADAIVASGGAVVSEHAPATHATRGTFPRRNRIISGLADATVVVEAGVRSGALITAGWALEQGRECFVVPGPLDAPASAGCLALLREYGGQVRVVVGAAELVEDLGLTALRRANPDDEATPVGLRAGSTRRRGGVGAQAPGTSHAAALATLPTAVARVARSLATGPRTADQIVALCGLPVAAVLAAITVLEDRGFVIGGYGRYHLAGALVDLAP